jgi:hypothetical protein
MNSQLGQADRLGDPGKPLHPAGLGQRVIRESGERQPVECGHHRDDDAIAS